MTTRKNGTSQATTALGYPARTPAMERDDSDGGVVKRFITVLKSTKELASCVRDSTVNSAKAADQSVHEHPYRALGIAVGIGAVLGVLAARRYSRKIE